jgi:hypothetical protein
MIFETLLCQTTTSNLIAGKIRSAERTRAAGLLSLDLKDIHTLGINAEIVTHGNNQT